MTISVIGASTCDKETYAVAEEVGRLIAERGATLVTGGLGGVMEAACRGAKETGGTTVGILPGTGKADANPFVDIPIITGMSHARNIIVVRSSDGVIAVGGEYGTLSEIAIALKLGKPVVGIKTWENITGIVKADTAVEAVRKVFELLMSS
ncbi:MAG: TIGR00725 family protein [Nitrospirae bacterium]|nr:TIGR00725 family protein [Nitrospirota bacterium]